MRLNYRLLCLWTKDCAAHSNLPISIPRIDQTKWQYHRIMKIWEETCPQVFSKRKRSKVRIKTNSNQLSTYLPRCLGWADKMNREWMPQNYLSRISLTSNQQPFRLSKGTLKAPILLGSSRIFRDRQSTLTMILPLQLQVAVLLLRAIEAIRWGT